VTYAFDRVEKQAWPGSVVISYSLAIWRVSHWVDTPGRQHTISLPIEHRGGRPAAYIDLDPVYTQIKLVNGDSRLHTTLDAHTQCFP
jgi:hypothetical protein